MQLKRAFPEKPKGSWAWDEKMLSLLHHPVSLCQVCTVDLRSGKRWSLLSGALLYVFYRVSTAGDDLNCASP